MLIFARQTLVPKHVARGSRGLLLEGDWDDDVSAAQRSCFSSRVSLDSEFDRQQDWIDARAHELAELALTDPQFVFATSSRKLIQAADVFALKLRYAFVKWLRVAAFLTRETELRDVNAFVDTRLFPGDADYVVLLQGIAKRRPFALTIHDSATSEVKEVSAANPAGNSFAKATTWRSIAHKLSRILRTRTAHRSSAMFLGNPRVLDPICAEFARRGVRPVWLRDEFAPRSWLKWRWRGGEQLVLNCDADKSASRVACSLGFSAADAAISDRQPPQATDVAQYVCQDIDLLPCVRGFLQRQVATSGADVLHANGRIAKALDEFRPACLILDEDATPRKRVAVSIAARLGIPSIVVQHGVPRLQFGFAPLAANCLLCWGESSRQRLLQFGIAHDRIAMTGRADWQPKGQRVPRQVLRGVPSGKDTPLRLLLIGTTPPRDDRPEPVRFHLTTKTHRQLLENAFAAVEGFPNARLVVKRHPRCSTDKLYRELKARYPSVDCTIVQQGKVNKWIAASDVVMNVASGAGVEAAVAGAKVIELIPVGGNELLPSARWGAIGSATTSEEIRRLIEAAMLRSTVAACDADQIFAATGRDAIRRAVNEIMARLRDTSATHSRKSGSTTLDHAASTTASNGREVA